MNSWDEVEKFIRKIWLIKEGDKLTRGTRLQYDLDIVGDDADEVMNNFITEFKIDHSNFKMEKYFDGNGGDFFETIYKFVTGKTHRKHIPITLGDLEAAIMSGKLDDDIIYKSHFQF